MLSVGQDGLVKVWGLRIEEKRVAQSLLGMLTSHAQTGNSTERQSARAGVPGPAEAQPLQPACADCQSVLL